MQYKLNGVRVRSTHACVSLSLLRLHEVVCLGSWQQDFDNTSHTQLAAFQAQSCSLQQLQVRLDEH